jgi:hypothetical protein
MFFGLMFNHTTIKPQRPKKRKSVETPRWGVLALITVRLEIVNGKTPQRGVSTQCFLPNPSQKIAKNSLFALDGRLRPC